MLIQFKFRLLSLKLVIGLFLLKTARRYHAWTACNVYNANTHFIFTQVFFIKFILLSDWYRVRRRAYIGFFYALLAVILKTPPRTSSALLPNRPLHRQPALEVFSSQWRAEEKAIVWDIHWQDWMKASDLHFPCAHYSSHPLTSYQFPEAGQPAF